MVTPIPRPLRAALILAVAASGLSGGPMIARGQNVFDPYSAYSYRYYDYTVPSVPNNLALPGAAREAGAYNAQANGYGISQYNTFDRWLSGTESDRFSNRGSNSESERPGDPYSRDRGYARTREADRRFFAAEEKRAQRDYDRDRLYRAAVLETDPTKRAEILRRLAEVAAGRTPTASRALAPPLTPTGTPRAARNSVPPLLMSPDLYDAYARSMTPPASRAAARETRGTAPPAASNSRRTTGSAVPERRMPPPSAIGERGRVNGGEADAPPPPPDSLPEPPAILPDDVPPPPR